MYMNVLSLAGKRRKAATVTNGGELEFTLIIHYSHLELAAGAKATVENGNATGIRNNYQIF